MKHTEEKFKPAWFVVNMCKRWGDKEIQRTRKPTAVFHSLAEAYAHAVELADSNSQGDYGIFECIGRVVSDPENTPGKPGVKLVREPATLGR